MEVSNYIALLSGVALFLFGMGLMGDGLKQAAGNKMEVVLYKLSSTPLKGVLLGIAVTAVIQSSSATSVMVVGFVNSSMMTLMQAISVILGSIFGTSVTGWVIALSELGTDNSGWLSLLSTSTLTGLIAIVGIIIRMTSKTKSRQALSSIMLGFAVLMYGISAMGTAVAPLKESEEFIALMTRFTNPLLGLLVGIVITAILQSASSAVGLLQTLAITGVIDFEMAFPILLGMNIGASSPVLLSSIGAKCDAKRAALSYLVMSTLGSLLVGILYYSAYSVFHFAFHTQIMDAVSIAFVNSAFRFVSVLVLFPALPLIEKLLIVLVPGDPDSDEELVPLEERFLVNPAVALSHARDAIDKMATVVDKNISEAIGLFDSYSDDGFSKVEGREDIVDRYEDKLGAYLVKITQHDIDQKQSKQSCEYLHAIGDLERIADHSLNLAECAKELNDKKLSFSDQARSELNTLLSACQEVLNLAVTSFLRDDPEMAKKVEPLEEVIDNLCDELKLHHIERLRQGQCTIELGYIFNDILTNAERISDHCSNIALATIEAESNGFDAHEYINQIEKSDTADFSKYLKEYSRKYSVT